MGKLYSLYFNFRSLNEPRNPRKLEQWFHSNYCTNKFSFIMPPKWNQDSTLCGTTLLP